MVECFSYDDTALIERAVEGIELGVGVVDRPAGAQALPAVEITVDGAYDYDARYNAGRVEYFAPARLSTEAAARVAEVAVAAHRALDLRDISRADIILAPDGTAHVLEVAVAPGMTETSVWPQAVLAAGHDPAALYRSIAEAAAAR
jgi:D-alanine-D-alanine ligase